MAVHSRTNLTMRQLAPLFGVSPATVCQVIQRLRPLLAIEPATRPADAVERLWIVDGTLIPVRDRKTGASSRNYRFSANVQVIMDAETPSPKREGRRPSFVVGSALLEAVVELADQAVEEVSEGGGMPVSAFVAVVTVAVAGHGSG